MVASVSNEDLLKTFAEAKRSLFDQQGATLDSNSTKTNTGSDPRRAKFFKAMRDRLQNIQITKKNIPESQKKHVMKLVEGYLDSRGLIPLSTEQEALHEQQMKFVESKVPAKTSTEVKAKLLSRYQRHMRQVLWEDLGLAKNQRFWAFLMDIAINTADLSKNYEPKFEVVRDKGKNWLKHQ